MSLRIVYMGSPDFAVGPLKELLNKGYHVAAVVTVPDKPAGRGRKMTPSPVKKFALQKHLPVIQPEHLSDEIFIRTLQGYQPDLQIIVAFRILPEVIWKLPPKGTCNLHASLLPQYRGAAPINWALINGETETGVTTFFLSQSVDTGQIIFQEKTTILPDETAGDLHDRLMEMGTHLVLKTVGAIETGQVDLTDQQTMIRPGTVLKKAPKLTKDDCRIDWKQSMVSVRNKIRGLSPIPGAFTYLGTNPEDAVLLKIYRTSGQPGTPSPHPGEIITDHKSHLGITTTDGVVFLEEVQLASKKRMSVHEFLRGFHVPEIMQTF